MGVGVGRVSCVSVAWLAIVKWVYIKKKKQLESIWVFVKIYYFIDMSVHKHNRIARARADGCFYGLFSYLAIWSSLFDVCCVYTRIDDNHVKFIEKQTSWTFYDSWPIVNVYLVVFNALLDSSNKQTISKVFEKVKML